MIGNIQNKIIKMIGFGKYRKILTSVNRVVKNIHGQKWQSNDISDLKSYSVDGAHSFFGYYDIKSVDDAHTKLLSHVYYENEAFIRIGYFDINNGNFVKLANSHAWNWQMGSRLRWFDDGKSIIFNDFENGQYISRIVDITGNELKRYHFPLYDFDQKHSYGLYTDYTILNHLRPGYGYSNLKIDFDAYYNSNTNGIFKADLINESTRMLISMDEIINIKPISNGNHLYNYINHISISPFNDVIMFFHLWSDGKNQGNNRMFFITSEGEIINIIDDFDRASHYCWIDKEHMLVTVSNKGSMEYRIYNFFSGEYLLCNGIATDGHPTWLSGGYFLTDTYPDRSAMENIYICNGNVNQYTRIFSIYHNTSRYGEYRCDLHPRIHNDLINFDTHTNQYRKQYLLTLKTKVDNLKYSSDRISLEPRSRKEKKEKRLWDIMKSEYLASTKKEKANALKVIYSWMFGPTFRVSVWVAKLQKTSNKMVKKLIRNHLEVKYSITVCESAKIGKHFRADHFQGIVIGPGAVIGEYCKFYQQVTIGQKNGKFPTIGNNVIIYPGAKVIGDITIGDNSIIGTNCVVTHSIPENSIVAGIPGKVMKRREL